MLPAFVPFALLLSVLVAATSLLGEDPASTAAESPPEQPYRRDVVALAERFGDRVEYATGSVIVRDAATYLVTAAHFAAKTAGQMQVTFSRGDQGERLPVSEVAEAGAAWRHFREFDVSVLRLQCDHELVRRVTVRTLPSPLTRGGLHTGAPVRLIGVPLLLGVSDRTGVSPTVVRTEVANADVLFRDTHPPKYALMVPIYLPEGYSGGVVVDAPANGSPQPADQPQVLRGILTRNTAAEKGGQFGIAVPGEVLAALLSEAEASTERRDP